MELCTAKVSVINKYKPKLDKLDNYFCLMDDDLIIISETPYVHKKGILYIVENPKNKERFTIDSELVEKEFNFKL